MSESVVEAFRFEQKLINGVIRVVFLPFLLGVAYRFYSMEIQLEEDEHLQEVSRTLLDGYSRDIRIHGTEHVPLSDPVLFVGNHAGIGDSLMVYMSSPRTDIYTLLYNNGMLKRFEEFHRYSIIVDKDNPMLSLRSTIRHLKAGQSVLLFPRGHVEDDPALYLESALATLAEWSNSIEFLARKVPNLQVVPFAVGGLISRKAMANPIVQRYKTRNYQHFLAGTFQMVTPFYHDPIASIFYGEPLIGESVDMEIIREKMAQLLIKVNEEQQQLFGDKP